MNFDIQELLKFKTHVDNDNIRFKEIIKEKLLGNDKIIYVLNNKELSESEAEVDDYFGVNILPYYVVPGTQHNAQNYVCYEVSFDEVDRYNKIIKMGQIIFYILCEEKTAIEEHTGIARQDLLAALITEEFNWSNFFGNQVHLVSDRPTVIDNHYPARTLIFEGQFTNSIAKTKDGKSMVINNYGTRGST